MRDKLVRSLRDEPVKYAHILGFTLLSDIHNEWIRTMLMEPDDYTLLGHRGSYKTTCLSLALALSAVLKPDKTSFFIRKTDDDVVEIIEQVQKILQSDLFVYLVKQIYNVDFALTTHTAYKVDTNLNRSTKGQKQIQGMGLNSSMTGKHADYVYTDDIVNVRDRASRAEREQTKRQYQELQNIRNRGGRIFNTGTPWHKEDCISTMMENVHRFSVYDTGIMTLDQQRKLRNSMSPSLYAANYELKHIAESEAMFDAPVILDDTDENTEMIHGGLAHVDAAYGGEDYTAYTAMHELHDGTIVAIGKLWQKHVDLCVPSILELHEKLQLGSISCETNGDKGYLAGELETCGMIVRPYSEKMNKFIKISTYLRKNWSRIQWLAGTDPEYLAQILDYTEFAEHDDAPDSAASMIRVLSSVPVANTALYLVGGV